MSDADLLKYASTLKVLYSTIIVAAVLFVIAGVFVLFTKNGKSNPLIFMLPIMLGSIVTLNGSTLKAVKDEKKLRGLIK